MSHARIESDAATVQGRSQEFESAVSVVDADKPAASIAFVRNTIRDANPSLPLGTRPLVRSGRKSIRASDANNTP